MKKLIVSSLILGGLLFAAAAQNTFAQGGLNRQPLIDAANYARSQGVDFSKPFDVEFTAAIGRDGRMGAPKYVKSSGDAKTVAVAKRFVSAFGASGWGNLLASQGIESVRIRAASNAQTFALNASAAQPNAQRAQTMAAGLAQMVALALAARGGEGMRLNADEEIVLRSVKTSASGKNVLIALALPATTFRRMASK